MKILLATGRKAKDMVKGAVRSANCGDYIKCDILTQQGIEIAAFTTPKSLRYAIMNKDLDLSSYNLILVSGLCSANFYKLEEEIATPIRLGPKHAYDLVDILPFMEDVELELSSSIPADEVISMRRKEEAKMQLRDIERKTEGSFKVKGAKIGEGTRMKVCAEIVDATKLEEHEIHQKMKYFLDSGADIIDIGAHLEAKEEEVERAIKAALSYADDVPLSVDTLDPKLILAAINAGADVVLSLNRDVIEEVGEEIGKSNVAAVIIPDFYSRDCGDTMMAKSTEIGSLFANIKRAAEMGINKIIADPLLNPVGYGIATSLHHYYAFRLQDKNTPLFFGVGNVTELMDADSIGINAILTGIASELGVSVLFTTEHSDKAKGCVRELRIASEMMMLSKLRKSVPKDLGIDLLILKEKRRKPILEVGRDKMVIDAVDRDTQRSKWRIDSKGSFRIGICEIGENKKIYAEHIPTEERIVGENAREVMNEILGRNRVSLFEHVSYLSMELTKAEIALKLDRSYMQDEEVLRKRKE